MPGKNEFEFYPGEKLKITAPFFCVRCSNCKSHYWSLFDLKECAKCGSDNILCRPAPEDKASP